jgi:DNA adenine methylase
MGGGLQVRPEPFLKWAGGKSQLLSQFEHLFPPRFRRYYEPFIGSGAVFLHVRPARASLSDSNENLIAVYQHIQQRLDDLLPILHRLRRDYHALAKPDQERAYYRMRERYNQLAPGDIEKSALLIVLNKTGYNGLYRENSKGRFNVPFGRYNNPRMFREDNLRAVERALRGIDLCHAHFADAVTAARRGDFVYFDPPYMPSSKTSSFTSYTRGAFGVERQVALADVARQLVQRGVLVMVSNSNTQLIRELYWDFHQHEVRACRLINSKASARGAIQELVLTSYTVERPPVLHSERERVLA